MTPELTFSETLKYLSGLRIFGAHFGLQNIQSLCERFDHPERGLNFIHIAGTNGKGSVAALLESVYRQAGYSTGLFTSPHLIYFGERIQFNRTPISQADIVRLIEKTRPILNTFSDETHPTFFEIVTLLALLYFQEKSPQIILWETGLGGRLDATNIVTPRASVITTISLEHQQYLGNTLAAIAAEKAGIIKENVPTITGVTQPEALNVIQKIASEKHSPLHRAANFDHPLPPQLSAEYQRQNLAIASQTISVLQAQFPVTNQACSLGFDSTHWDGRFQIIQRDHQTCVLDGAHNIGCFTALVESLQTRFSEKPKIIIGVLADKDWSHICKLIANAGCEFVCVPVTSPRTLPSETLAAELRKYTSTATKVSTDTLGNALKTDAPLILICGSLYLIGEALNILSPHSNPHPLESKLNDWGAAPQTH